MPKSSNNFARSLLEWHSTIERNLPWKEDKNVFYIWLSEIILQQTRVEQGIPYFLKFKQRFKNVSELALVSDQELMKMWEGLGYYSRARNMHSAAKEIAANGGHFPETYEALLALKGVGPYTAAAIASFAFDLPTPVVDGNVNRVITRIYGVYEGIDTSEGIKKIKKIVSKIFDADHPAAFNQAIMDFGALHCTPKVPKCLDCPFQNDCVAYAKDEISLLPFKSKKVKKTKRTIHYLILQTEDKFLIRKRTGKGIWMHLYEFVHIEEEILNPQHIKDALRNLSTEINYQLEAKSTPYKHLLTHQTLTITFHHIKIDKLILKKGTDYFLVERKNLRNFAFPKIIDWYLSEKSISLEKE